jgi:hypothetical protein
VVAVALNLFLRLNLRPDRIPASEEDTAETDDQAARRHGKDKRVLTIQASDPSKRSPQALTISSADGDAKTFP